LASALTIGGSYIAGGLIPLLPYIAAAVFKNISVATSLLLSVVFTLLALFIFGFIKGRYTGTRPTRSALQTALIGSVAAGAAFLIARLIS
jgi:VIT1/CCC1 family predicted Fe2+/Mn2+ transporter